MTEEAYLAYKRNSERLASFIERYEVLLQQSMKYALAMQTGPTNRQQFYRELRATLGVALRLVKEVKAVDIGLSADAVEPLAFGLMGLYWDLEDGISLDKALLCLVKINGDVAAGRPAFHRYRWELTRAMLRSK